MPSMKKIREEVKKASYFGNIEKLQELFNAVDENEKISWFEEVADAMIDAALSTGKLNVFQWISSQGYDLKKYIFENLNASDIIIDCMKNKQLDILQCLRLESGFLESYEDFLPTDANYLISEAAGKEVPFIEWVHHQLPSRMSEALNRNPELLHRACESNRDVAAISCLFSIVGNDAQQRNLIAADNFLMLRDACGTNNFSILEYLYQKLSAEEKAAVIADRSFDYLKIFCKGGMLDIVEQAISLIDRQELQEMLHANNFQLFFLTCQSGQLEVLQTLLHQLNEDMQQNCLKSCLAHMRNVALTPQTYVISEYIFNQILEKDRDEALPDFFMFLCSSKDASFAKRFLEQLSHKKQQQVLQSNNYSAMHRACLRGNFEFMQLMLSIGNDSLREDILTHENFTFLRDTCSNGHWAAASYLINQYPEEDRPYLTNLALSKAALRNDIQSFMNAVNVFSTDSLIEAIASQDFELLKNVLSRNLWGVGSYMIDVASELHPEVKYAAFKESCNLRAISFSRTIIDGMPLDEKAQFIETNDFEVLHNACVNSSLDVVEYIVSLLSEEQRARIVQQVFLNQHPIILVQLMTIESVNELIGEADRAIINSRIQDFNATQEQEEPILNPGMTTTFGLQALANDRESSMRAPSRESEEQMNELKEAYRPEIASYGSAEETASEAILDSLRKTLKDRYNTSPAKFKITEDREIELPFEWKDFYQLCKGLPTPTKEAILKAYYSHPDHTAYRFLETHNQWALTGYGPNQSSFASYKPLIALLYLAAKDKNLPEIDGINTEGRLAQFILGLAYIQRAHNWDHKIQTASGRLEYADDFKQDSPSCYSGTKSRLYQSLIGHPLYHIITPTDIENLEVYPRVKEYFHSMINAGNIKDIQQTWDTLIEEGVIQGDALASLNIPAEVIKEWLVQVQNHYGRQLADGSPLSKHFLHQFALSSLFPTHAAKFGGHVNLSGILESKSADLDSTQSKSLTAEASPSPAASRPPLPASMYANQTLKAEAAPSKKI